MAAVPLSIAATVCPSRTSVLPSTVRATGSSSAIRMCMGLPECSGQSGTRANLAQRPAVQRVTVTVRSSSPYSAPSSALARSV